MQQQTPDRNKIIRNKPLTPIEKLHAEKNGIEEKCRIQEKKLDDDFVYIKDNASSLILSGISTLLFPPKNTTKENGQQLAPSAETAGRNMSKSPALTLADYIAITKSMLPVVWGVLQPIIITWGIRKAKSVLSGLFSGKRIGVRG